VPFGGFVALDRAGRPALVGLEREHPTCPPLGSSSSEVLCVTHAPDQEGRGGLRATLLVPVLAPQPRFVRWKRSTNGRGPAPAAPRCNDLAPLLAHPLRGASRPGPDTHATPRRGRLPFYPGPGRSTRHR
jgi:hypothetical protein